MIMVSRARMALELESDDLGDAASCARGLLGCLDGLVLAAESLKGFGLDHGDAARRSAGGRRSPGRMRIAGKRRVNCSRAGPQLARFLREKFSSESALHVLTAA